MRDCCAFNDGQQGKRSSSQQDHDEPLLDVSSAEGIQRALAAHGYPARGSLGPERSRHSALRIRVLPHWSVLDDLGEAAEENKKNQEQRVTRQERTVRRNHRYPEESLLVMDLW